jgi:hypothetical protein
MDKAKQLNRKFADEPFQWSISNRKGVRQKPLHHEAYIGYGEQTLFDRKYVLDHMDEFVALNHKSTDFLLENTHTFIIRQDLPQIAESWLHLFKKAGFNERRSLEIFSSALNNIDRICEYLLNNSDLNVIKCEALYKFTARPVTMQFILTQQLIDQVYLKYK